MWSLLLIALAPTALLVNGARPIKPMFDTSKVKFLATTSNAPRTQYIDIPIDHFASKPNGTFKNRYWFNDTHYEHNGPVFVYDVGEGDAEPFVPFLEEAYLKSSVMQLAQKYKGIGVVWEHRYYGKSIPFVGNTSKPLQASQWQYLTVEQALEDVVSFANNFSTPKSGSGTLAPSKTPWVFLGGSYPGVRAALLRVRNPDVIYASWASSAPVQAQVNMSSYWGVVERALPRNCSNDFVAMANYANSIFPKNDNDEAKFKQELFLAHTGGQYNLTVDQAAETPDGDAAYYLLDPLGGWQNQGLQLAETSCNYLETANRTQPAPATGIFATQSTSEAVEDYLTTIYALNAVESGGDAPDASPLAIKALRIARPADNTTDESPFLPQDDLAWTYQYCSQFGFYQIANPNNSRSIQAKAIDSSYFQAGCNTFFTKGTIPSTPAVDQVNKFGGWSMNPSRVMFTNGEFDPWRSLSVASEEFNAPQRKPNKTIPTANGHSDTSTYFALVYSNQVHVPDMASSSRDGPGEIAAFEQGLALFSSALDVWLPTFNTTRNTQSNSTNPKPSGDDAQSNGAFIIQAPYYTSLLFVVVALLASVS